MVSRSAVFPANQFTVLLRYDDFSLKDVMEDYGFGIEEIKIRMVLGVNGGLVRLGFGAFFFPRCINTVEESAARFLPQGSASWRFSHLPLFQRHPDVGNTQKLILVCLERARMQVFWIKWRVND